MDLQEVQKQGSGKEDMRITLYLQHIEGSLFVFLPRPHPFLVFTPALFLYAFYISAPIYTCDNPVTTVCQPRTELIKSL